MPRWGRWCGSRYNDGKTIKLKLFAADGSSPYLPASLIPGQPSVKGIANFHDLFTTVTMILIEYGRNYLIMHSPIIGKTYAKRG